MTDFIIYAAAFVPMIIGYVIYTEVKEAGTPVYDSNGNDQIGTQVYIGHHTFVIK